MRSLAATSVAVAFAHLVITAQGANPPISPSMPLAPDAPFTVAINTATIEGSPAYVADAGPLGDGFRVITGNIRHLGNGGAHAATNAETQLLFVGPPNARLLMTVAEGLYRIVAKRSAGIRSLADLRGKRITLPPETSAHYSLVRMLASAGMAESEVTVVNLPRDQMAAGVVKGQADAISMWEPESQKAVEALGADAIVFQDKKYRELFSLYTTTGVLNDARRRRELVSFVRAIIVAAEDLKKNPKPHFPLIAKVTNWPEDLVARSWEHHAFPMAIVPDLVDVLVEEEQWVARIQKRQARTREALAALVDTSVLAEARQPAQAR